MYTRKWSQEIWGVVNVESGEVCWTCGGSSTSPRLMVYESESAAKRGLKHAPPETCVAAKLYEDYA